MFLPHLFYFILFYRCGTALLLTNYSSNHGYSVNSPITTHNIKNTFVCETSKAPTATLEKFVKVFRQWPKSLMKWLYYKMIRKMKRYYEWRKKARMHNNLLVPSPLILVSKPAKIDLSNKNSGCTIKFQEFSRFSRWVGTLCNCL